MIVDKLLKMVQKRHLYHWRGVLYRRPSAAYFSAAGFRISLKGRGEKDRFPAGSDHAGDGCKAYGHTDVLPDAMGLTSIQSHRSFVYNVLSQKRELWSNQVRLFELAADRLCYYEMKVQRGMRRNMVQAEASEPGGSL